MAEDIRDRVIMGRPLIGTLKSHERFMSSYGGTVVAGLHRGLVVKIVRYYNGRET